ncbi:MAG: CPBP family intramembrane metalloprotease [Dehalococcoidales bacterium]|nr:MAG: CPBP family intramembrane metalloprotease [Dehalococcoidales bacterium]
MLRLLKTELRALYTFLRRYIREVIVTCMAALCLALNEYHPIRPDWVSSLVYYAIIPILSIVFLLRRNPLDFGLRLGNWRIWGLHLAVVVILGLPILYAASRMPSVADYYTQVELQLVRYSLEIAASLFAWEFILRGFLLFGLKEKLGEASILVQMVPFVLLHFGKPEIEMVSTIIMGIYFGYVAYRSNSCWPAVIMHIYINIIARVFVNLL